MVIRFSSTHLLGRKRRENYPLENKPFVDDYVDWMGSDQGQLSIDVSDVVWRLLEKADVEAKNR